jgi:ABC-type nitrate/sulfonate/bicarbonate transport system permease component
MIHGLHRLEIYTKRQHWLLAFAILLLPFLFLVIAGKLGSINESMLVEALAISFYRLVLGYLLSLVIGVSAAISIGNSRFGEAFMPILDVLQNVPSFALIPVFALLFGFTDFMAVLFIATSVVWPILFSVLSAIRNQRTDLAEAATIFGARGLKRILHFTLPLAFPAIITGSIVGISIGWEAVIGLEIIGLSSGIGLVLNQASQSGDRALLVAGIGCLLFLVFVLNRLIWVPLLKKTKQYA